MYITLIWPILFLYVSVKHLLQVFKKNTSPQTGKTAQSIKRLFRKHEEPNLDLQKERTGWAKDGCNSRHWEGRARKIPGAH